MAHAVYESVKAERVAAEHAVKALGGYSRYSLPQLTAWGDAK